MRNRIIYYTLLGVLVLIGGYSTYQNIQLERQVKSLTADVARQETQISTIDGDVSAEKDTIDTVETDVNDLATSVDSVQSAVDDIKMRFEIP